MQGELKRLPDSELEVMLALWSCEGETTRAELDEKLMEFDWSPNTVNTFLSRLQARGFVTCRREGRMNCYLPAVSKREYLEFESRGVLSRLYGGSLASFVAALSGGSGVDERDIDELQTLLDKLKGRDGDG